MLSNSLLSAASIYLSSLSTTQGFAITGVISGAQLGYSLDTAGDINKDTYPDLILGAPYAFSERDGVSYVLFGSPMLNGSINLLNLDTSNSQGFIVYGVNYQYVGYTVSTAGDINNDGYDDFMMGAYGSNNGLGVGYVLFGKEKGFTNIQLTSLESSNLNGFYGSYDTAFITAYPVTNVGDINFDGYDDMMISTTGNQNYVIYGKSSGFTNVQLSTLAPPHGFYMTANWAAVVASGTGTAGNINGDKYSDIIIGFDYANSYAGITYIVYGGSGYFEDFDLTEMTPSQGFSVSGAASNSHSGYAVSSAGDINGDGIDDFVIGAPMTTITVYVGGDKYTYSEAGAVYVIYGKSGLFNNINLAVDTTYYGFYNTSEGFQLSGGLNNGYFGASIACAGDFNGDNYPDLVIGAYGMGNDAGATYLIYGGRGMTNLNVGSLTAAQGIIIYGVTAGDYSSWSVAGAGDLNHDGYMDILIGAPNAQNNYGEVYVIYGFGKPTPVPTNAPTVVPTHSPSLLPTIQPTTSPSVSPTLRPSAAPTVVPTHFPSLLPTAQPTASPTESPTLHPSAAPTFLPTILPTTSDPTELPTINPTTIPTKFPTERPSFLPTAIPSSPSSSPTSSPTSPTSIPSSQPTFSPTEPAVISSHDSTMTAIIVGSTVGGGIGLIFLIVLAVLICKHMKRGTEQFDEPPIALKVGDAPPLPIAIAISSGSDVQNTPYARVREIEEGLSSIPQSSHIPDSKTKKTTSLLLL